MTEAKDLLAESRRCLANANAADYPDKFSVNWWWSAYQRRNLHAIAQFESIEAAVRYGLDSRAIPFDHRREGVRSVIEFKIGELERLFPDFSFREHSELRESMHCDAASLEDVDGVPYSNILLWHVNTYLRSTSTFHYAEPITRVIEIGSGYGALARVFKIMNPGISYTLVDLPEMLFFAQIFLSLNFPNAKILYLVDDVKHKLGEHWDFILVPVQMTHLLTGESFNIVVNTGSFQEMTGGALEFWMNLIEQQIQVTAFFSCNYFMKLPWGETGGESVGQKGNFMCPVLDPFWQVKHFRINPEIVTVDAGSTNWLELIAERIPAEERDYATLQGDASALLAQAKLQPKGSEDWFMNLWMANWRYPTRDSISEMLDGIRLFKLGLGATVMVSPKRVGLTYYRQWVVRILKATAQGKLRTAFLELHYLANERPWSGGNEYTEEKFYKRILSGL